LDRYLRATLAPIRSAAGATVGVVIVLADITDEKALERSKTMFVSMVAHEIKAPIAAVEGYLRLIRDGSYSAEPDQIPRVLDRCLERTDALLMLVQDLLEINRRDGGRQQRRLEPLDLAALVLELAQFHTPTAARRGIAIDVHADPALPTLLVDRNDIERIVTNLLSNAIKYNKEGGKVSVRVAAHPAGTMVEVRDTGVGMARADVARLGEEFFRAKDPRTRSVTGTGLGLALVKKIIESYLGELQVQSVPDEGSTFRVVLPVMEPHT
jgi:signal transduction histidine kinase